MEQRLAGEGWARGVVVFATSGSSGLPKWIVHRREGLLSSARAVNEHLGVQRGDHWFLALPAFHVGGFGVAARAFAAGCGWSMMSGRWNAAQFVAGLAEDGGTHTSLVPTQVFDLVAAGLRCPGRVRVVVVGGGALENGLGRRARELGWPVLQSYGMTEAGSQVATEGMESLEAEFCNAPLPVMAHWEVRVGLSGVLELRGPSLFMCHVVPDAGGLRRVGSPDEGWFATTDRVELRGRTLRFLGRSDRVVKVLGELVDLAALERRLAEAWDGQIACRVLAVEDARMGRCLLPVFEKRLPDRVDDVLRRFNGALPGYSRLAKPRVVPAWPRTPIGKVDLRALEARMRG